MTRNEIVAFNAGVAALAAIAERSAEVLRGRLTDPPTRYNFAIAGLEGIVEASASVAVPLPPSSGEPAAIAPPKPSPAPASGAAAMLAG